MNKFTTHMDTILQLTLKHKAHLESNPKHLALLMKEYDDLHYASRFHDDKKIHDWNNPKYAIIDLHDNTSEEYADLVYDAWASTIRDEDDEDSDHPLEHKQNKTMDEIVEMCLDPSYRYKSIFPNKKAVLSHYLCTIGSGLAWNKDGFISSKGPSGVDTSIFSLYKQESLPPFLQKELSWLEDKEINECKERLKNSIKEEKQKRADSYKKSEEDFEALLQQLESSLKGEDLKKWKEKQAADKKKREEEFLNHPYYPIYEEYALICKIPKNAHPSYLQAAKEVGEEILRNDNESKENKEAAKKILANLKNRTST